MVEEELDETLYWLELIVESGLIRQELLNDLIQENNELFKIISSSITKMKRKSIPKKMIRSINSKW